MATYVNGSVNGAAVEQRGVVSAPHQAGERPANLPRNNPPRTTRTHTISARFTLAEEARLEEQAANAGMNLSDYVRKRLLEPERTQDAAVFEQALMVSELVQRRAFQTMCKMLAQMIIATMADGDIALVIDNWHDITRADIARWEEEAMRTAVATLARRKHLGEQNGNPVPDR
jgi:hypothetical protein